MQSSLAKALCIAALCCGPCMRQEVLAFENSSLPCFERAVFADCFGSPAGSGAADFIARVSGDFNLLGLVCPCCPRRISSPNAPLLAAFQAHLPLPAT